MKAKINDRFVKQYCFQALKQVFEYLRLFSNLQTDIKNLEFEKLIKKI